MARLVLATLLLLGCGHEAVPPSAPSLAQALREACPAAAPDDATARARCADALSDHPVLRALMPESIRWGAQTDDAGYDLARSNTTHFNPYVWRRMYLSTFNFEGSYTELKDGERTIIRVPVTFRGQLDPGDYPYPFWHSDKKWRSYESARELLFIFEQGQLSGVLRSAEQDAARPHLARTWDQQWQWTSTRGPEPQNALYTNLLASDNPHRAALEAAYRAFSELQRGIDCVGCHNPANKMGANPLELMSYPNQALNGRHGIVARLERNDMPPSPGPGQPAGIQDEALRQQLLTRAREFAELGDRALDFEGDQSH